MDIDQQTVDAAIAIAAEVAIVAIAALIAFMVLVWLLTRAAKESPKGMIAIMLGLLTILALVGYLITREEIAATLVATGIGAFAGALQALFGDKNGADSPKQPEQSTSQDDTTDYSPQPGGDDDEEWK